MRIIDPPSGRTFRVFRPATLLAALLLLGCAATDDPEGPDGLARHRLPSPARAASEEGVADRGGAPPADERREAVPVLSTGLALFRGLLSKPALRPVSSLYRMFFFAADTTVDFVKPASLLPTVDAPPPPLSAGPGMDLEAWERRLDAITGVPASQGAIRFLVDGDEFFSALVEEVEGARSSIDFRTYIFDTDEYATAFADLLKDRAEEVDVRVLVDGLGTALASLVSDGSPPQGFVPPASIAQYLREGSKVAVRTRSNPWFAGDHVKTFVIDRRVAFVGGMNIGREYRYDWHDLMMEVRGPVVGVIDREFGKAWSRAGPFGDLGYLAHMLKPKRRVETGDGYPLRLLFTRPGDSQIYRAQLAAIRAARRYIHIENPYFSDDEILAELIEARRRGVDVRVILPQRGDSTLMDYSNVVAANAMFRNGIRVYFYPGFSHVKAAVYDGWACLGSANLDKMSLRVNEELNLATSHRATVETLERRLFDADFERSAEMRAPLPENWSNRLAALLANQF